MKNKIVSFGEYVEGIEYKVLNERMMRASGGIMLLMGIIGFINGFILKNYIAITYLSGFILVNFFIGIFVNPKFSPTVFIGKYIVSNQTPIYIGAIQKKFAWSLGFVLTVVIFILSFRLLSDPSYFGIICRLCVICLTLIYFETAFGICLGCKLYDLAINLKIIKKPEIKPNCEGDSCKV